MRDKFDTNYLKYELNINAEYVKRYYGITKLGHYDIYNGSLITIRSKDGRHVIEIGLTFNQFVDTFANVNVKEKE